MNSLCTLGGPQAPEQGKHVPEVGLEPGSRPCKHCTPAQTYGIRANPAPVRPSPGPKVWTLSTPPNLHTKSSPKTAAPRIDRVRRFFALRNLILPEQIKLDCNRVLPAPVAESRARPHDMLSLSTLHNDVTSLQAIHAPIGITLHDRAAPLQTLTTD